MKINIKKMDIEFDDGKENIGKKFEAKFRNKLKEFKCYCIKIPDYSSTKVMTRSPADFLVVYEGNSFLFEVKHTNNIKKFNILGFRNKQLIELRKHKVSGGGKSFIVFFNPDGMFIVDFYQIMKYIDRCYETNMIPFSYIKNNLLKLDEIFL